MDRHRCAHDASVCQHDAGAGPGKLVPYVQSTGRCVPEAKVGLSGALTWRYRVSPLLYQINTRVWLTDLSRSLSRNAALDDIPDAELDGIARMGFDWVWLLSVWQTGPVAQQISRTNPEWRHEFQETLHDLQDDDIAGSGFAITGYTVIAKPEPAMSSSCRSCSVSWNSWRHSGFVREICCAKRPSASAQKPDPVGFHPGQCRRALHRECHRCGVPLRLRDRSVSQRGC